MAGVNCLSYVLGLLVAAVAVVVIPQPFGLIIVIGLILGALWSQGESPARHDGPNAGADAERERIRQKMAKYAEDASRKK